MSAARFTGSVFRANTSWDWDPAAVYVRKNSLRIVRARRHTVEAVLADGPRCLVCRRWAKPCPACESGAVAQ
jgi:hypothetical protein